MRWTAAACPTRSAAPARAAPAPAPAPAPRARARAARDVPRALGGGAWRGDVWRAAAGGCELAPYAALARRLAAAPRARAALFVGDSALEELALLVANAAGYAPAELRVPAACGAAGGAAADGATGRRFAGSDYREVNGACSSLSLSLGDEA